jgi:hypothetical protein
MSLRMWRHDSSERTTRDQTPLERQTPPQRSSESASFDLEERWVPKPFFVPSWASRVVSPPGIAAVERSTIFRVITIRESAILNLRWTPKPTESASRKLFTSYSFQTGIFLDLRVHRRLYTAIHPC